MAKDELSGADIKAVCTEASDARMNNNVAGRATTALARCSRSLSPRHAPLRDFPRRPPLLPPLLLRAADDHRREAGLLALRERRMKVTQEDFTKAKEKALYRKKGNIPEGLYL